MGFTARAVFRFSSKAIRSDAVVDGSAGRLAELGQGQSRA
jgi:hypothetical protein